jgi:hypothetical protein
MEEMKAPTHEPPDGNDARPARVTFGIDNSPVGDTLLQTTIGRLNARGLSLLTKAAQASLWAEGLTPWKEVSPLFVRASETVLGRAARCPMVLLDFNFQRVAWWNQVVDERPFAVRRPNVCVFPSEEAIPLARDLLLEAWSAARSLSRVSCLVFGMAPEVTALIARLSARDIDQVVVQEIQALKPRWENRPMFWKALFHAAAQMDDQILGNVHLHCLQLLGGELASSRAPHRLMRYKERPAKPMG